MNNDERTSEGKNSSLLDKLSEHLQIIKTHTGINPKILIIILAICLFFTFIGYFDVYITNLVGVLLPAYWSIKAIESPETEDDKQWLTYWVVFGLFTTIDLFGKFVLSFVPFYFFFKLIFLIWLFMPNTRGAAYIYDSLLRRCFKKYEKEIDTAADSLLKVGEKTVTNAKEFVRDNQGKIIKTGLSVATKLEVGSERKY